ncbi:uncharacterized protein LOC125178282 [Hyalella azteca]|uniref:Uncharacterized protein LOC125178282 n=1 Tax=Hyalella azteca TaxID=294128 RepID=A0A979FKS9_HYAAZ|nr:uncharacterized protein LOC125178282 [Hyalella azteca]
MFGNQKALQRCYDALKFIGVFLERRKRTASPVRRNRIVPHLDFLAKFGTSYGSFGTLTEEYVVNEIYVTAISTSKRGKPLTIAEKILKDIENQMVLIDQALELLEDTYSWVLIAMSIWYLTDLLFAFYMVMTNFGSNGVSNPTMSFVVIVEGMSILFLIHNPADTLLEAEEDFLVHLRMFICHVPDEELSRPNTGLVLAVQRPRSLTLGKFGTIGRSSFLNTLAFMMSYVVTTIQFYYAAPPAAPTPHVGFINATDLSPPPMTNSSNYTA